jgi:hypothetical protein
MARRAQMDVRQLRRDMELARRWQHVGATADGVHRQAVAALYAQHRWDFGVEQAPMAGVNAGVQKVFGHGVLGRSPVVARGEEKCAPLSWAIRVSARNNLDYLVFWLACFESSSCAGGA